MKKTLTFIPLGIGISAAIIYVFNIISYRIINDSVAMSQILSSLKIYLYISIISFIVYFIIRVLLYMSENKVVTAREKKVVVKENNTKETISYDDAYEPIEFNIKQAENKDKEVISVKSKDTNNKQIVINKDEKVYETNDKIYLDDKYCPNCGQRLRKSDKYCTNCGKLQYYKKKNSFLRSFINVLEIVIMILVLYFLINMIFDYKEKTDPNFKSPFNISMTK